MDLSPVLSVASPFFRDIHHDLIQHFQETVIRREYCLGFCNFPQLPVKSLNCVCCINQAATACGLRCEPIIAALTDDR